MKIPAVSATPVQILRPKPADNPAVSATNDADPRAGKPKLGAATSRDPVAKQPETVSPTGQAPYRPQADLTLQGLLDNWGTNNSNYDLTGDGIVDANDLFQFLGSVESPAETPANDAGLGGSAASEAAPTESAAAGDVDAEPIDALTIDDILNAWGSGSGRADLNGDGTVNSADLFEFLGNHGDSTAPPDSNSAFAAGGSASEPAASANQPGGTPIESLTLQDILQAWGSDGGRADLNGDGTVNADDIFEYIASLPSPLAAEGPAGLQALQQLADRLVEKFQADGHIKQPPEHLHQAVSETNLGARERKILLKNVASRYPTVSAYNKLG